MLTHRDVMFDLRTQLHNTDLVLSDESFHRFFTQSVPPSPDAFIMFHDDAAHDVDLLCQRFARWEARRVVIRRRRCAVWSAVDREQEGGEG